MSSLGECSKWGLGGSFGFLPDPAVAPENFLNKSVQQLIKISTQFELDSIGRDLRTDLVIVALNFAERPASQNQAMRKYQYLSFR